MGIGNQNPVCASEDPGAVSQTRKSRFPALSGARLWSWVVFIAAIIVSLFVHELGHCLVAWVHGYPAVPTPAKEYLLRPLPENVQLQLALGGLVGSVIALLLSFLGLHLRPSPIASASVAGAMTAPGFYTLRFFLAGRGHDATEFQEAQSALGLSYSGHAADWFFVSVFTWQWRLGL